MSVGQVLGALLRHVWLIIGAFLLAQMVTWALFAVCYRWDKEYTARGQMRLVDIRTSEMRPWEYRPLEKFPIETSQREQKMKLMSEENLRMLLIQPEAKQWAWVKRYEPLKERKTLAERFRECAAADPVRESTLVEVQLTDDSPDAAAEFVNKLMHFYEDRTRNEAVKEVSNTRRVLNQELDNVQYELDRINTTLNNLRQSPEFEGLDRLRADVLERVSQLGTLETSQGLYLQQVQRSLDALMHGGESPDTASSEVLREVESNPELLNMTVGLQQLLEEQAQLEKIFGPNHPVLRQAAVRVNERDRAVRLKRAELIKRENDRALKRAQGEAISARMQLETIQADLKENKDKKRRLETMWEQYRSLQAEETRNREEHQRLTGLIREMQVKINRGLPQMEVFIEAPKPTEISFPRWEMFLAAGLILGAVFGVGLALTVELVDTSVRTPRDLSEQIRLPLLGFVPVVDNAPPRSRLCRTAAAEPMSLVAESFRQIRTNLLFAAPAGQLSSIAVTSAARDEGKTTVAVNLAITIALSGRRVLLADANFRRPAIAETFALTSPIGLSNVLTSQATLAEAAQPTDVPNLTVMPTGPTPPNPAELMGSATMRAFLDQADLEYDLVIFDGPPALLVSDALILGTMVDGVVIVVRGSQTSRGMVGRLRDQLGRVNARVVGAVLNAARPTRGGYFRKSQQQYEEYTNDTA